MARDPNFLAAWCSLEELHDSAYWNGFDRTPARLALGQRAVDQAVKLRPDSGETHLVQARHFYWGYRDYDRAREHLAIAGKALPNSWEIPWLTGLIDRRQGKWESSNQNLERASELNPRNVGVMSEVVNSYGFQRRFAEAMRVSRQVEALLPKDLFALLLGPGIEMDRNANLLPMKNRIAELIARNPLAAAELSFPSLFLALNERDVEAASRALAMMPKSETPGPLGIVYPRAYFAGVVARLAKQPALAQEHFAAARLEAAALVSAQPDDAKALAMLALIDAGLGNKDDALRAARRATEMLPIAKDAFDGPSLEFNLAVIAVQTGEKELALDESGKALPDSKSADLRRPEAQSRMGSAARRSAL